LQIAFQEKTHQPIYGDEHFSDPKLTTKIAKTYYGKTVPNEVYSFTTETSFFHFFF